MGSLPLVPHGKPRACNFVSCFSCVILKCSLTDFLIVFLHSIPYEWLNTVIYLNIPLELDLGEGNGTPPQYSCLENPMDAGAIKRHGFDPWVRKIPWKTAWQPTPVFLPGKSHGQRSLMAYSPWNCKELDTTEAT